MSIVDSTKIDAALNYKTLESSEPTLHYRKVYPANGGTRTVQLTNSSTQNMIFNIPVEVVNLGESYLEYIENVASQTNLYSVLFKDVHGEIQDVLYRDTGSQNIVEARNVNLHSHVMNRLEVSQDKLKYSDELDMIVPTNAPLSDVKSKRFDNTVCSRAYDEVQHLEWSALGADALSFNVARPKKIYLKDLVRKSFFSMAKNSLLPVETYLDITFSGARVGFGCTSATDPTQGNAPLASAALAAIGTGCVVLTSCVLNLAYETNRDIVEGMKQKVAGGMTIPIPWTRLHQIPSGAAAPFTYNLPLDVKQHGQKIKEIIYAPFTTGIVDATTRLLYDHCNNGSAAINSKVTTYQTSLDNQYLQRDVVNCPFYTIATPAATAAALALHDDYAIHRKILDNTTYLNQPAYSFNWVHIDRFGYSKSNDNKEGNIYVDGFDLVKPINYNVNVLSGAAVAINNVCIVNGQKLLSITQTSYAVV